MNSYREETIELKGRSFKVSFYYDESMGAPWEEHDGHGPVREVRHRSEKRPGERIIHADRGACWVYDWQAAVKTARKDGWCMAKNGAELEAAVKSDLQHLQAWLRSDWHWCGVAVNLLDSEGEPIGGKFDHAIWGVGSDGDYWRSIAEDLAGEIMHERATAWKKHLKERRAAKYWASRDVVTLGAQT